MRRTSRSQNTTDGRAAFVLSRILDLDSRPALSATDFVVAVAVATHYTGPDGRALVTAEHLSQRCRFQAAAVLRSIARLAAAGVWAKENRGAHGLALTWQALPEGAAVVNENATVARTPNSSSDSTLGQLWRIVVERAFREALPFGAKLPTTTPVHLSVDNAEKLGALCVGLAETLGDRDLVPQALRAGFIGWMRGVVSRGRTPVIAWAAEEEDSAEIFAAAVKDVRRPRQRDEEPIERGPRRAVENTFASFATAVAS
jgi:hypothetical protein